jgi:hypothetical protein
MSVVAYSRPFWPLFLHVLGAMVLVGAIFTVLLLTFTALRRPDVPALPRAAFRTLLFAAIPAWLVMRVCGQWIYSKEFGSNSQNDPTWVGIGFIIGDLGLLILLITTGVAFWWNRKARPVGGRIVLGLSSIYLILLTIAWLAMSGKWD